ncbi:MAG TPA: carotenoid biosynthesis protein [Bacteroidales bacterium]|nr:carotenoid biosynthesis protein [Bacteroidales bacterium]
MNLYPRNILPQKEVKKFVVIFYTVGLLGFIIPFSRDFFIKITPLALLISSYLLFTYHNNISKKDVAAFMLVFVLGFLIEAAGVNTGQIFGHYSYGSTLGPALWGTPLLIGLNWLFLAYSSLVVAEKISHKAILQIAIAPTLMLIYDLVLEQVAPILDMWTWQDASVPLKNYIAWWCIGLAFTGFLKISKTDTSNPLALILLVCQFAFFLLLFLVFNLLL